MNERAEQTADVLGKLTVLGTIVLPMNIITGLWGMNTKYVSHPLALSVVFRCPHLGCHPGRLACRC